MKAGRKNLKQGFKDDLLCLHEGHSIMQVVSLRGSNLIEVMDAKGIKSLALFQAKFQRSFWIKTGSFVVVDESVRDQALESGSKIACMVSQVLSRDQVRTLEKTTEWPASFRAKAGVDPKAPDAQQLPPSAESGEDLSSDGEDGLPPLVANLNRVRPVELYSNSDSGSEAD